MVTFSGSVQRGDDNDTSLLKDKDLSTKWHVYKFVPDEGERDRQTVKDRADPVFSQDGVSSASQHHVLITFQCTANRTIVSGQKQQDFSHSL